jgi:HEAT repeat protein
MNMTGLHRPWIALIALAGVLASLGVLFLMMHSHSDEEAPAKPLVGDPTSAAYWRERFSEAAASPTAFHPPMDFPLRINPDPRILPALRELLKDPDPWVRRYAVTCLGLLKTQAKEAAQDIAVALEDPAKGVRWAGAVALGEIGHADAKVLAALQQALDDDSCGFKAAEALVKLTDDRTIRKSLVPHLLLVVEPMSAYGMELSRCRAVGLLERIGADAEDAIPMLETILRRPWESRDLRMAAAGALGSMGPVARKTTPAFVAAFRTSDAELQASLLRSLEKIDPQAAAELGEQP